MKFTQEYLTLQKEKRRAYQKEYQHSYYLKVTKNKRIAHRKWLNKAISTELDNK